MTATGRLNAEAATAARQLNKSVRVPEMPGRMARQRVRMAEFRPMRRVRSLPVQ